LDGGVDDADQMGLARLEVHLKARSSHSGAVVWAPYIHAVDEAGVQGSGSEFGSISDSLSVVVL
jgi:hypothetical protein